MIEILGDQECYIRMLEEKNIAQARMLEQLQEQLLV
jgi:hypothetical protein